MGGSVVGRVFTQEGMEMFFKEAKVDDGLWLERLVQKGWDESELISGVVGYVLEMPKLAISLNSAAPFSRSVSLVFLSVSPFLVVEGCGGISSAGLVI